MTVPIWSVMEHYSLRKFQSAEVWDMVRAAYLAGETGPAVARRFGVSLDNLRKKASGEGWTRRAHARATIPAWRATVPAQQEANPPQPAPPPPLTSAGLKDALDLALNTAATDLAAGRGLWPTPP